MSSGMHASFAPSTAATSTLGHPLDQLTPHEISRASRVVRQHVTLNGLPAPRFNTVMLEEPRKDDLLAFEHGLGPRPARVAYVVVLTPGDDQLYEGLVQLNDAGDVLLSWIQLEGVQPMTTPDDNIDTETIVKGDPIVAQLLKERYGLDISQVVCDAWSLHGGPAELGPDRRFMQAFLYARTCEKDNEYAHPLDMVPVVDLNKGVVIHIDKYQKPPPFPKERANFNRDLQTEGWRTDLKTLDVVQPEGPSYSFDGNLLMWQKWHIRVGFNPREGLVLHNVQYKDGDKLRPVLYRASLVEMAVPYGDPTYPYTRKCAFDVGDYGLGFNANSLELGCDCLGHIKYLDGYINNKHGEPVVIKKAVCIHEEDAGILWKHYDSRLQHAEVRRSRRLVLSMVATFANYEYAMYWYFYQDGTIQFELKLTGVLSTSVLNPGEKPAHGTRVGPQVNAAHHQHFFCMRIDPSVDDGMGGRDNVISELNAERMAAGPDNPSHNGFVVTETDLTTVHTAQRMACPTTARAWKIKNPRVINPVTGEPVAWKLVPETDVHMMAGPESMVAKRAVFATKHLWVTPYADDQRYPAGQHVVQSQKCLGLGEWTKEDKDLVGKDPVLWYSFGITHVPRIEDYPVMPVEHVGFVFKPCGFFTCNPALDIPPEKNAASKECCPMPVAKAPRQRPVTQPVYLSKM